MKTLSYLVVAATVAFGASNALAQSAAEPAYGPELQGFDYPYPVEHYRFSSQGQELDMAYLDVKPSTPNGQT
ncbi:hypothetical protein chiPu_0029459, partial [Chiloscyllium punctatum]|nr:hypothetical protein [Chiloscyllium punctatum]